MNDNEVRDTTLQFRVTETEAKYIRQVAQDNQTSVSSLVREIMVGMSD